MDDLRAPLNFHSNTTSEMARLNVVEIVRHLFVHLCVLYGVCIPVRGDTLPESGVLLREEISPDLVSDVGCVAVEAAAVRRGLARAGSPIQVTVCSVAAARRAREREERGNKRVKGFGPFEFSFVTELFF